MTTATREELLAEIDRLVRVEKAARAVVDAVTDLGAEHLVALSPELVVQLMNLNQQINSGRHIPVEWNEEDWQ